MRLSKELIASSRAAKCVSLQGKETAKNAIVLSSSSSKNVSYTCSQMKNYGTNLNEGLNAAFCTPLQQYEYSLSTRMSKDGNEVF